MTLRQALRPVRVRFHIKPRPSPMDGPRESSRISTMRPAPMKPNVLSLAGLFPISSRVKETRRIGKPGAGECGVSPPGLCRFPLLRLRPAPRSNRMYAAGDALPSLMGLQFPFPAGKCGVPNEIDPEIAALIGVGDESAPKSAGGSGGASTPDFDSLFGQAPIVMEERKKADFDVDLSRTRIAPVEKETEAVPNDFFSDPDFLKKPWWGRGRSPRSSTRFFPGTFRPRIPRTGGCTASSSYPRIGTCCTVSP